MSFIASLVLLLIINSGSRKEKVFTVHCSYLIVFLKKLFRSIRANADAYHFHLFCAFYFIMERNYFYIIFNQHPNGLILLRNKWINFLSNLWISFYLMQWRIKQLTNQQLCFLDTLDSNVADSINWLVQIN